MSPRAAPIVRAMTPDDVAAIRAVMEASRAVDALPGIDDAALEHELVRIPAEPDRTAVAVEDGRLVGYITPRLNDLTVHPAFRRRGHGRRLVAVGLEIARLAGLPALTLYAPMHLAATRAFVHALGFRYHSSLWRFELAPDAAVPPPDFPADVVTRSFDPAAPLEPWVALLNEIFADHPTPISFSMETIRAVNALPEFDPDDILLVAPASEPDAPIAFARVELERHGDELVGDVALIGVRRAWRGRGLGRELLRWSVARLRSTGAGGIVLTVEARNERATRIYRAAGFSPTIEWPQVSLPAQPG